MCHQPPGGQFAANVIPYDLGEVGAAFVETAGQNQWFSVNPVDGALAATPGRRGGSCDVTRLAAVWVDLDVKLDGCQNIPHALRIVDEISTVMGMRPSVVVYSGTGLHPYWPINDGQIVDDATRQRAKHCCGGGATSASRSPPRTAPP
jgi:hypothetical protein